MAYAPLVRQDGFQLPSPTEDDRDENMFHFASKFPNFADELATLAHDMPYHFTYDTPAPRSRSRSRPPSLGPARPARRPNSHVSSTSPPPRPHPHAIHIPPRGNTIGAFFVPNGTPDYSLPTPDSVLHHHFSPYYPYPTPNMPISPTDVDALIQPIPKLPASAPSAAPIKPLDPELHLSEKRRRRRESHNAVERRRRDNINERIAELAALIPGVLFECDRPPLVPAPGEDLFALGFLNEPAIHVLPTEDGLPDLPEESAVKKDPGEEGDSPSTPSISSAISVNGANEQSTIKANKGMILRKSVEYIRYLQQLLSAQASRGRDLEERNRALERELAMLRADSTSSSSPSSKPSSIADMEMEDATLLSMRNVERGRQLGRARDKSHGMVM